MVSRYCFEYSTIFFATGISFSGGSDNDTLIVSPIPLISRLPIPSADLILPSSPSPASVTPRCKGYLCPPACIIVTRISVASIITCELDDFIESTRLLKSSDSKILINSIADSAMPRGVLPYLVIMRSDSEP